MHWPPLPSTLPCPDPHAVDAIFLKVEGYHAEVRAQDAANRKPLSFPNELSRSDLVLIGRALRAGWPITPATLSRIAALVMQARLAGRSDRLVTRAAALMNEFPEAFRTTASTGPAAVP
jgi:hypothetical protein